MCHSRQTIIYCIREEETHYLTELTKLVDHIPIIADSIPTLFAILATPSQCVDGIVIGIDTLFNESKATLVALLNAIRTVVSCNGGVNQGSPLIAVAVNTTSSTTLIGEILGTEMGGIFPAGIEFHNSLRVESIQALLKRETYIPRQVSARLYSKPIRNTDIRLTTREAQVLSVIRERGASNSVIAGMLGISESTVKVYMSAILRKYGVRNRTQLALFSH